MAEDRPPSPEDAFPRMSLGEHLDELRGRLIRSILALFVAMVVAFVFWQDIWDFVRVPFVEAMQVHPDYRDAASQPRLWSLDPGEGFLSVLKVCFLAGLVLAAPVVLWQMWGFVSAGLYRHERRVVRIFFPVSVGLFALGMVIAYKVLIPFGLRFLISWNLDMGVATEFRIRTYLSTCLTMVFGMAVLFELPLVMLFLQATNLVSRKSFRKYWRFAVLLAFVVGMILTDPSPVTQVLMALPIVGLYFLGIWGGRFVGEGREPFRWYKTWPLVLGLALVVALLVFARDINEWSARVFVRERAPTTAPPSPPGPPPPEAPG